MDGHPVPGFNCIATEVQCLNHRTVLMAASSVGFCRHMRWETFRKEIVANVLRDREIERMARPKLIWQAFRTTNSDKILSVPWR